MIFRNFVTFFKEKSIRKRVLGYLPYYFLQTNRKSSGEIQPSDLLLKI